jgi:hypothetical protein
MPWNPGYIPLHNLLSNTIMGRFCHGDVWVGKLWSLMYSWMLYMNLRYFQRNYTGEREMNLRDRITLVLHTHLTMVMS